MKFEENLRHFKEEINSAAKDGTRAASLSLEHRASVSPSGAAGDGKKWYVVDIWLAGPDSQRKDVEWVNYELHPTFTPREVRRTDATDFRLSLRIWGEFTVRAQVRFRDGSSLNLARYLTLPAAR
jgi:hypothetical protein